ncbi:MAG: hypothetical protein AB7D51_09460 [Desulfovibrionaceae bacterium]
MKRTMFILLILAAVFAVGSGPAQAGCPVADKKQSDSSMRQAQAAMAALQELEEGQGTATVEIVAPGTAVTATPGAAPTGPGEPNSEDKAVLDALTIDHEAARAVMP